MNRRSLLFSPLARAACAATGERARAQRFKGQWDFHFETSAFTTEDGRGPWWLSGEGEVWTTLTAPFGPTGRPWGRLAIEVEGELSEPGHYGHMAAYERELRVTHVISARLIAREGETPHGDN